MTERNTEEAIRPFIHAHIRTLEHLEVLLMLVRSPDRWWSADAVAREAGVTAAVAGRILEQFASGNLLAIRVTDDVRYQFQPGHHDLRLAAEQLAEACVRSPLTVTRAITDGTQRRIRDFADAFRIRRDDHR